MAAVDGNLNPGTPAVDAAAYINNKAQMGGATTLFVIGSQDDLLLGNLRRIIHP
ncbi:MAG: DUF4394 domain-containing protein [Acidobacteria bacterium]|nr:DUF4394 domain-containing protein [Acidobacteriota bacterium]